MRFSKFSKAGCTSGRFDKSNHYPNILARIASFSGLLLATTIVSGCVGTAATPDFGLGLNNKSYELSEQAQAEAQSSVKLAGANVASEDRASGNQLSLASTQTNSRPSSDSIRRLLDVPVQQRPVSNRRTASAKTSISPERMERALRNAQRSSKRPAKVQTASIAKPFAPPMPVPKTQAVTSANSVPTNKIAVQSISNNAKAQTIAKTNRALTNRVAKINKARWKQEPSKAFITGAIRPTTKKVVLPTGTQSRAALFENVFAKKRISKEMQKRVAALSGKKQRRAFRLFRPKTASSAIPTPSNKPARRNTRVASLGFVAHASGAMLKVQHERVQVRCLQPGLVSILNKVERRYGKPPVITSGFRSKAHNRRIHGARNSTHIKCEAADIQVPGVSNHTLAKFLRSLPERGGVGTYCHTKSVHIDVGKKRDWNWRCKRRRGRARKS